MRNSACLSAISDSVFIRILSKIIRRKTSTNVLWIRNSNAYNEPIVSHALGGLSDSQRRCCPCSERPAGGRHGRHLENMTSCQKLFSDGAMDVLESVAPARLRTTRWAYPKIRIDLGPLSGSSSPTNSYLYRAYYLKPT